MTSTDPSGPELQSLGGHAAPEHLADAWGALLGFTAEALDGFWSLLVPAVIEPADPTNRERFETFRERHGIQEAELLGVIGACGLLLRQASAHDLDREHFGRDLTALSKGGAVNGVDALLERYDEIKGHLRQQLVTEALADHGKVLVGIDWRVDQVANSNKGARLGTTVVMLTFRYRDGDRLERITLQLTPEALSELKAFTERIGG